MFLQDGRINVADERHAEKWHADTDADGWWQYALHLLLAGGRRQLWACQNDFFGEGIVRCWRYAGCHQFQTPLP